MIKNCFVGTYFSIGETTTLSNNVVQSKITNRIYKIEKVAPYQYIVFIDDLTDNFKLEILFFESNKQLHSGSSGQGIDQILFENNELVAYYSILDSDNNKVNGRYILNCQY